MPIVQSPDAPVQAGKKERACKHCGCTYYTPCTMNGEGCAWVTKDECSACISPYTRQPYRKTLEAKKRKSVKAQ